MQVTRRFFLQSTGAISAYLGIAPIDVLAKSGADDPVRPVTRGRTLVVIFLRGGADGLNLVVPHGDPAYAGLRRSIGIPGPASASGASALDLDGFFGLHPRLAPLMPHFDRGTAVAAQAVGYGKNTRSHFEEQDVWETGIVGNTVSSDGWLNRHLVTSAGHGRIRAVAIGDQLPRIMHGKAPAYAVRGIDDLALPPVRGADPAKIAAALEHAYCADPREHAGAARDVLAQTAGATLDGIREIAAVTGGPYEARATYPRTEIGQRLMQVARLIRADVGLEVAEVDYGGWDTHQGQGGTDGQFANLAGQLADALAAFAEDLGDRLDDVVVTTLTDFGRTAAENGTGGTDHGWANAMLLLGGGVARGNAAAAKAGADRKVVARWPGLAPDQLHEGRDLLHTIDFRDVLAELVRVHLGNPNLEAVLPGHRFEGVGLVG